MTKLKLKFVNGGKPFLLPNWTVGKHKAALEEMNKLPKNLSENDKDLEFEYQCIFQSLKMVDDSITVDDLKNLHPTVLISLFEAVYNEGKCDIYFREKGKKTK